MQYRVADNNAVQTKKGMVCKPGQPIQVADFDSEQFKRLLEIGWVTSEAVPEVPQPQGRPALISPTPWMLDPDGLRGLDLDALNVMILERDPEVPPCATIEEAVYFLSQDYQEA